MSDDVKAPEEEVKEETVAAEETAPVEETAEKAEAPSGEAEATAEKADEAAEEKPKKKKKKVKKDPLKEAKAEVASLNDKLLRLHAEYDNFRKRTAKDLRNSREAGVVDTIMPFLQVYDHMKMASMSLENGDNIDMVKQGVVMILNEFQRAVADLSVEEINATGVEFDPNLHAAVAHEASEDIKEGMVIRQWNPGYRKGERLIKPAKVVVSSGPEVAEEDESTDEKGEE